MMSDDYREQRATYEQEAWDWWTGGAVEAAQQRAQEQERQRGERREDQIRAHIGVEMRQYGYGLAQDALPMPRGCLFYILVIVGLGVTVEFLSQFVVSLIYNFASFTKAFDAAYPSSWVLSTSTQFTFFAALLFIADWAAKFIGLSILGGMSTAVRRLFALYALCSASVAIVVFWYFLPAQLGIVPSPFSYQPFFLPTFIGAAIALILMFGVRIMYGVARGTFQLNQFAPWRWVKRFITLGNSRRLVMQPNVRPQVNNPKLQSAFDQLFRENAGLLGGTAGAIRRELTTGVLAGGKSHVAKGRERIVNLLRILREQELTPDDRAVAKHVLHDLADALRPLGYVLKDQQGVSDD